MAINLRPNCVAQYLMNDNAANAVVIDGIGKHHGTFKDEAGNPNTDAHSVAGKINTALNFDGTDDYIDTGDPFQSVFQDSFSINVQAKPVVGEAGIMTDIFGVASGTANIWMDVTQELTRIAVRIIYSTITPCKTEYSEFIWEPVDWIMLTFVAENLNNTKVKISLYANGSFVGSETGEDNMANYQTTLNPFIGLLNNDGNGFVSFDGSIDNVMIFDKALTSEEVEFLFNNGNGTERLLFFDADPLTAVMNALWALLEGQPEVVALVATKNRIKLTDTTKSASAEKLKYSTADLPELLIEPSGGDMNPAATNTGARIIQRYGIGIADGDLRLHKTFFPLKWAVFRALAAIDNNLGLDYVRRITLEDVEDFRNTEKAPGWSAGFEIVVEMWFSRTELKAT